MWQYCRHEPNATIIDSESCKFKAKIRGRNPDAGNAKDVEIAVSLKYFSNFLRTFEIPLINNEINLILTWSMDCAISAAAGAAAFVITDTKLYVLVVT